MDFHLSPNISPRVIGSNSKMPLHYFSFKKDRSSISGDSFHGSPGTNGIYETNCSGIDQVKYVQDSR